MKIVIVVLILSLFQPVHSMGSFDLGLLKLAMRLSQTEVRNIEYENGEETSDLDEIRYIVARVLLSSNFHMDFNFQLHEYIKNKYNIKSKYKALSATVNYSIDEEVNVRLFDDTAEILSFRLASENSWCKIVHKLREGFFERCYSVKNEKDWFSDIFIICENFRTRGVEFLLKCIDNGDFKAVLSKGENRMVLSFYPNGFILKLDLIFDFNEKQLKKINLIRVDDNTLMSSIDIQSYSNQAQRSQYLSGNPLD